MTIPTSDNPHLSEVFAATDDLERLSTAIAVNCKCIEEDAGSSVAKKVRQLLQAATSANTRRAYRADLAHFLANGGALPTTPAELANYLAIFSGKLAVSTLARRLVAIGRAHTSLELKNPCQTELVRLTLRGIRRTYGRPQRRALALTKGELGSLVAPLGVSKRDLRDRALLLLGFHGAFRRSELSAVNCKSIVWSRQGVVVTIPKSKTDQERKGRDVAIRRIGGKTCPVLALRDWLNSGGIAEGPVFRPIGRTGRISEAALSGDAVSVILKRRLKEAGREPTAYSGHSLRAGFVTTAVNQGMPAWKIRSQTGHSSDAMLDRYIRQADAFSDPWRV